jgi:hypothetical protein
MNYNKQTPGVTGESINACSWPVFNSDATFEVSRRGSLGGSGLVTNGKALIYIGIDLEAQQAIDARNQEIGLGTCAPEDPVETRPYSAFLAGHDATEAFVYEDDPRIDVVVEDHAYLTREKDGYDPWVRVRAVVAEAVAA